MNKLARYCPALMHFFWLAACSPSYQEVVKDGGSQSDAVVFDTVALDTASIDAVSIDAIDDAGVLSDVAVWDDGVVGVLDAGFLGDRETSRHDATGDSGPVDVGTAIHPCASGDDNCDDNATCVPRGLLYSCVCNEDFVGDGVTCEATIGRCERDDRRACDDRAECFLTALGPVCVCREGYAGDGFSCLPFEPCAPGNNLCDENAVCIEDHGDYSCSCIGGFVGDGYLCEELDTSCVDGTHNCHLNAICIASTTGFSCVCDEGYEGDGVTCVAAHPCVTDSHNCGVNAHCVPAGESFTCECDNGFVGDGFSCEVNDLNTWFVDCGMGSNSASGHATSEALRTLAEVNSRLQSQPLRGGQSVLLKRGTSCRGSLNLIFSGSDAFAQPVRVGAYGDSQDARPEISGSVPIMNAWTLVSNPTMNGVAISYLAGAPIYRVQAGVDVKQVFVNGERKPISSWVDAWSDGEMLRGTNWNYASNGTVSFTFPRRPPLEYGTTPGHKVLIRNQEWYWALRPIVSVNASSQTITFDNSPVKGNTVDEWTFGDNPSIEAGVELRNALSLVGSEGRWSINTATQELHLWSTAGDPGQQSVEVSTGGALVSALQIPAALVLEIRDLSLVRAGGDAIHIYGDGAVSILNVHIEDANEQGIYLSNKEDGGTAISTLQSALIDGCEIINSNGFGIAGGGGDQYTVTDNVLSGNGRLGTQQEVGNMISSIRLGGSGTILVEGNRIVDSGYAGIVVWYGGNATIRGNYIHNSCVHLNDCGAFYTNGQNQLPGARLLVENNFIRRSIPSMRGSTWDSVDGQLAAGVYLDHQASHATIRNNAILTQRAYVGAIHIGGGSYNTIENNTVYATSWPSLDIYMAANMSTRPHDNFASGNVFYTQSIRRANLQLFDFDTPAQWNSSDPKMLNLSDDNYHLNPLHRFVIKKVGFGYEEFGSWQPWAYMLHDDTDPTTVPTFAYETANLSESFSNVRLAVNDTFASTTLNLDTVYCNHRGEQVQGTITLPPLSARLLIRCGCNNDGVQNNLESPATCQNY